MAGPVRSTTASSAELTEAVRSLAWDDTSFPFAGKMCGSMKCCSKCGSTKTPQWREGPCGPKTLCNACGVKRTRKLRAEMEADKRRRLAELALSGELDPSHDRTPSSDSLEDSLAHISASAYAGSMTRRPQRRAAEEAAQRTAHYARTGHWGDAEGASGQACGPGAHDRLGLSHAHAPPSLGRSSPASSTLVGSVLLSPALELEEDEVAFTPLAAEAAARHGVDAFDSACYAAVNLMTMAAKDAGLRLGRAGPHALASPPRTPSVLGPGAGPSAVPGTPQPLARGAGGSAPGSRSPPSPQLQSPDFSKLYRSLPPARVVELMHAKQSVEHAVHAARSATADVAAFAAVLAEKQAMALAAREEAASATKRLRRLLAGVDVHVNLQEV